MGILAAVTGSTAAFAPSNHAGAFSSALRMSEGTTSVAEDATASAFKEPNNAPLVDAAPPAPVVPSINGWTADAAFPCYGLPGTTSPLGFFDPLGFSKDADLNTIKRYREAEIMHGRVAMMATIGYIIGESTPTITYGMDVHH